LSSSQADVRSIEALKDFRAALALYSEEALGALGAVHMEAKRTLYWAQHDRRNYWAEQVKRARQAVASARAEVSRRRMAKASGSTPAFSEQKELLRVAEARLREAEAKVILVRKWEPALNQAVLEYRASTRRIGDLAGGDVPRALAVLGRMIDALEAYLREPTPSAGPGLAAGISAATIAGAILDAAESEPGPTPAEGAPAEEPPIPARGAD